MRKVSLPFVKSDIPKDLRVFLDRVRDAVEAMQARIEELEKQVAKLGG